MIFSLSMEYGEIMRHYILKTLVVMLVAILLKVFNPDINLVYTYFLLMVYLEVLDIKDRI